MCTCYPPSIVTLKNALLLLPPFTIREKKSRQEFHRVIFVLKAKGEGTMPWRHCETKGEDQTGQNSGEWSLILALTWQQLLYFVSAAVTPEMLFTFLSHAWPLLKFAFLIKHLSMSNEAKAVQEVQYFRSKLVFLILLVYFVWNLEKGHWIDWC